MGRLHSARWRVVVFACALLAIVTGCDAGPSAAQRTPTTTPSPTPTVTSTPMPTPTPTPNLDQRIDAYISHLSMQQQVGQTLMLSVYAKSYNANLNQALTEWHLGSALFFPNRNGGPVMPTTANGVRQLLSALQAHADTPLLLATDEEGGEVDRLQFYFPASPSPQQLAASGSTATVAAQAKTDAQRMRSLGLNVDFAPLADVWQGGGIDESRTFGTTPSAVTTYAGAFLDGLQQNGVAGTLKHWPGLGASTGNPDKTLPTVNHTQAHLNAIDFAPFRALIAHHPDMIMATTVLVPAYDAHNPAVLSPVLLQQVLRGQLGYQGVIVTDAMDTGSVIQFMAQQGYPDATQGIAEACVRALIAGADLIEAPYSQAQIAATVAAMTNGVQSGRISQTRLHDAIHRIIALKVKLGLLKV